MCGLKGVVLCGTQANFTDLWARPTTRQLGITTSTGPLAAMVLDVNTQTHRKQLEALLLDVILNGTVFFIMFSGCPLHVYRNNS